jgi:spermidine synthase
LQDAEEGSYDAIIVDSSDPVGPAEVLFEKVRSNGLYEYTQAALDKFTIAVMLGSFLGWC